MNVIGSKYEDRSTRQEARRRDMAACMVTHGRGLDDFVWQEILEEIPAARNLRHLGEGKIAFQIHQEASVASTGAQQRRGDVREEKGAARGTSRQQKDFRADTVQKEDTDDAFSELHTKGNQREQNTALKEINAALATNLEENKWISALSNIFKLKLVERVFLLLHCEDIDGKATHEGIDRKSNEEDILKDYENKLASVAVSNYWDILAVRVRRLRQHQDGERRVWCQDPDSCPGALRKRQERKELREKRVASAASREVVGSFSKHQEADSINREPFQGRETTGQGNKKRKLTDDCRKKTFVESYDVFKQENIKMKDIPDSNIEETSHRSVRKECEFQNVFRNERQKLQSICIPEVTTTDDLVTGGAKDSPGAVISHECASSQLDKECKDEVVVTVSKTTSATNKVNMISENNKSLENSQLMSSACPPSTPESSSEKLKRESQDCETKSKEHVSTFRVSSRVSGPHKHFLPVKWINRTLTQQLNSAMTSWLPDWRLPLVDLYVNITVSHFVVGAALSPRPLSLRPYIPHPTLRSTISHLMATLSQLPPKATVLDPMCGGGSILLEAAMSFDVSHVIASDSSRQQLEIARCNLHNLKLPVTLLEANAEGLPLQDSSVDTVLCDFPFGQKYKLIVEGRQLLAQVLQETQRLLVCGGRAVFLLSPKQHQDLPQLTRDRTKPSTSANLPGDCLTLLQSHLVSLGETSAYVVVMGKECPSLEVLSERRVSCQ